MPVSEVISHSSDQPRVLREDEQAMSILNERLKRTTELCLTAATGEAAYIVRQADEAGESLLGY